MLKSVQFEERKQCLIYRLASGIGHDSSTKKQMKGAEN